MTAVFTGKAVMLIRKVRLLLTDSLTSNLCRILAQMRIGLRACVDFEGEAYGVFFPKKFNFCFPNCTNQWILLWFFKNMFNTSPLSHTITPWYAVFYSQSILLDWTGRLQKEIYYNKYKYHLILIFFPVWLWFFFLLLWTASLGSETG